jgi:hypothetical protein
VPARGEFGARIWYLRQVASVVTIGRLAYVANGWFREDAMFGRLAGRSAVWFFAGACALVTLLGALLRSGFGPPAGLGVFIAVSVLIGASAAISTWRQGETRVLWRIGLVCGILVASVLVTRLLFEVLDPVDPVERFLAQARDDYSEFDYPRRWVPAAVVALILMGGGLRAAWQTRRVGMGTLAAVTASFVGSLVYLALALLGSLFPFGPRHPLGNAPYDLQFSGNLPSMLIPVLAMLSTVLGTIGALFGRAIGSRTAETAQK